jgi:5-methyltetrahydrofolate--homocysteine methyltransferase
MSLLEQARAGVVIGDGAMGTELQRAGLPIGECGESWALAHPDRLQAIHEAYLAAGSEVILTNSFGANPWVLGRYELADQYERLNREAATIARRAAGGAAIVLGDIGPCGQFLRPLGEVDPARLAEAFRRQAHALLDGGADGIIVETMSAIEEAVVAVEAAREAGAPVVAASMAFDELPNGSVRTMMGVSPEQAARALAAAGADILGANCGTRMRPASFVAVVRACRGVATVPVMIQANAGQPELIDGAAVYRLPPDAFAEGMAPVLEAGTAILGGCCGTTPAHIEALHRRFKEER